MLLLFLLLLCYYCYVYIIVIVITVIIVIVINVNNICRYANTMLAMINKEKQAQIEAARQEQQYRFVNFSTFFVFLYAIYLNLVSDLLKSGYKIILPFFFPQ